MLIAVAGAALLASCVQPAASPTPTAQAEKLKAGRTVPNQPMKPTFGAAGDGAPSEALVVAVTNGRLDFGKWERIFSGQTDWLARESRRPAAEAGAGPDLRRVGALRAILSVMDCGSGIPQQRDGPYDKWPGLRILFSTLAWNLVSS